ncbi:hypothetical protein GCM10020331_092820 [Ectobacillus funiculus]
MGNRSYGVAAAAKNYYGIDVKDLKKMTLPQAAMLAGLPQSPNNYDPSKPEKRRSGYKASQSCFDFYAKSGAILPSSKCRLL